MTTQSSVLSPQSSPGTLYGVGVGPGAPDLLTLRAQRVLTGVPVVAVPRSAPDRPGFAERIVADLIDPGRQEIVELYFPMTKDAARLRSAWDKAVSVLSGYLRAGRDVAFLTEGDPFFYSTFIYLYERLRARHPEVPVEVVPGVCSPTAVAAAAGWPLANGDERVAILPASYEADGAELRTILGTFDTVILLKANSVFDRVLDLLEELDLADRAVWVRRATTGEEEIVRDVRGLRGQSLDYFSMLIIRTGRAVRTE